MPTVRSNSARPAIYVLLSRTINHLDRSLSHFKPQFFVWFFIPCDIVSLVLQAAGGALSATQSDEGNKTGVRISMAGLILQVVTLVIFVALFVEYVVRFVRKLTAGPLRPRMKVFLGFLFLSIISVLVRCIYSIDELRNGYDGPLIRNEPLFMVLEAAMMVLAVLCLHVAHPGLVFDREPQDTLEMSYTAPAGVAKYPGSSSE